MDWRYYNLIFLSFVSKIIWSLLRLSFSHCLILLHLVLRLSVIYVIYTSTIRRMFLSLVYDLVRFLFRWSGALGWGLGGLESEVECLRFGILSNWWSCLLLFCCFLVISSRLRRVSYFCSWSPFQTPSTPATSF